eukprot:PhF_6_TR21042/c1_g1_i1/m.30280
MLARIVVFVAIAGLCSAQSSAFAPLPASNNGTNKVECSLARSQDNCTALGPACKWFIYGNTAEQGYCLPGDVNPSTGLPQPPKTDRPNNQTDRPEPPKTDRPSNQTDRPNKVECGPARSQDNCTALGPACKWMSSSFGQGYCVPADSNPSTGLPQPPKTDRPSNQTDRPE